MEQAGCIMHQNMKCLFISFFFLGGRETHHSDVPAHFSHQTYAWTWGVVDFILICSVYLYLHMQLGNPVVGLWASGTWATDCMQTDRRGTTTTEYAIKTNQIIEALYVMCLVELVKSDSAAKRLTKLVKSKATFSEAAALKAHWTLLLVFHVSK